MDWSQIPSLAALRAFEAAARSQSFKAAAAELGVSPGAISQQVRKLEHSLGIDLFERLPHGLRLTEVGARYLPRVTQVFDDLTEATEEIAPDLNARKFAVGLCPQAVAVLPKGWPTGVTQLNPYVRTRVPSADLMALERGEIDCLIRVGKPPGAHVTAVAIGSDASGSHPLYLLCKPSLAHCRQISELVSGLEVAVAPAVRSS